MPTVHQSRLMSLADREFRREADSPKPKRPARAFKAMTLNLSRFDPSWDRKRGSAARLMGVLLREGPEALHDRVCANDKALKDYDEAASWFAREARYLRRHAGQLDTAASRLHVVLDQYRARKEVPPQVRVDG